MVCNLLRCSKLAKNELSWWIVASDQKRLHYFGHCKTQSICNFAHNYLFIAKKESLKSNLAFNSFLISVRKAKCYVIKGCKKTPKWLGQKYERISFIFFGRKFAFEFFWPLVTICNKERFAWFLILITFFIGFSE